MIHAHSITRVTYEAPEQLPEGGSWTAAINLQSADGARLSFDLYFRDEDAAQAYHRAMTDSPFNRDEDVRFFGNKLMMRTSIHDINDFSVARSKTGSWWIQAARKTIAIYGEPK